MSVEIEFVKMSGAGNDFVVLGAGASRALGPDLASWVRRVCRRGVSVGADGVLLVEPEPDGRVQVRFFNPDGGPAFCGNGSRCAARLAHWHGWVGEEMVLDTSIGDVPAAIVGDRVRLILPPPRDLGVVDVEVGSERLQGRFVLAGVPHFVVFVDDVARAPLAAWGPVARRADAFGPAGANIDLVERRSDGRLALRTWERGVEGETLCCGSGAVAAAFAERLAGGAESVRLLPQSGVGVEVELPGRAEQPERALLTGDARIVFRGTLHAEATSGFPA